MKATFYKDTISKINFDNFDYRRIITIQAGQTVISLCDECARKLIVSLGELIDRLFPDLYIGVKAVVIFGVPLVLRPRVARILFLFHVFRLLSPRRILYAPAGGRLSLPSFCFYYTRVSMKKQDGKLHKNR